MKNIPSVHELISELKKGNKVRITYNRMIDDCLGGGWTEELWFYNDANTNSQYVCQYPISTYKNDFYTVHTLKQTTDNMKEAIRDLVVNSYDDQDIAAIKIKVESDNSLSSQDSIKEKYLEQMKRLNYVADIENNHIEADNLLCRLLEELGFVEIVEEYIKLPKWYS